ncbi:MAG: hypothetical protein ACREBV_09780, partial [Candidatus Zixiibacteriota bacterium]
MDAPKNFKLLTLAFVSMFCVTLAPAINALDLGLKAGFSLSDQSYNYTQINFNIDRLRQTGFVAGAFVEQNLGQLTSIRLEVDYVQKGSALEFDSTSEFSPTILGTIRLEDQIDYLSLSLLATPS